jgi:CDP-glucose 4,6-dehydratase
MGVNAEFWNGKRVFVTGHTGFKGAWLCQWLLSMGAQVSGLSLAPEDERNLWDQLNLSSVRSHIGDIRDPKTVASAMEAEQPDIVLHLAAQSLVRRSYFEPAETFDTNVMGTVHVLNAIRQSQSVKAGVIVTTDKCYRNEEGGQAFAEDDAMGGHDPYSASKGAAELVTAAMRDSFFSSRASNAHSARIASARAGNVIGGGDWAEDRIVPDIIRGCMIGSGEVVVRSPNAIRPWQHVMEPLAGYLMLAQALFDGTEGADSGWNFGPDPEQERPVLDLTNALIDRLGQGKVTVDPAAANLHEAGILRLNSAKARGLGWRPQLDFDRTMDFTADWYGQFAKGISASQLCQTQIQEFMTISRDQE